MNLDYNIFILWSTARDREAEVMAEITKSFEVVRSYDIVWSSKLFTQNLSRFYGKKLPSVRRKLKLCGENGFLLVLVKDNNPKIASSGKNQNISSMKYRLRKMLGDNYIHASDNQQEAEENLFFLLGKSLERILKEPAGKKPHLLKQDLIGAPTWLDEDKLSKAIKSVPNAKFDKVNRVISGDDCKFLERLLNAHKIRFSLKKQCYKINIRGRDEVFVIKQN